MTLLDTADTYLRRVIRRRGNAQVSTEDVQVQPENKVSPQSSATQEEPSLQNDGQPQDGGHSGDVVQVDSTQTQSTPQGEAEAPQATEKDKSLLTKLATKFLALVFGSDDDDRPVRTESDTLRSLWPTQDDIRFLKKVQTVQHIRTWGDLFEDQVKYLLEDPSLMLHVVTIHADYKGFCKLPLQSLQVPQCATNVQYLMLNFETLDIMDEDAIRGIASLTQLKSIDLYESWQYAQPLTDLFDRITAPLKVIKINSGCGLTKQPLNALVSFAKFASTLEVLSIDRDIASWPKCSETHAHVEYPRLRKLTCQTSEIVFLKLHEPGPVFPRIEELAVLHRRSQEETYPMDMLHDLRRRNQQVQRQKLWPFLRSISGDSTVLWTAGLSQHVNRLEVFLTSPETESESFLIELLHDVYPEALLIQCWGQNVGSSRLSDAFKSAASELRTLELIVIADQPNAEESVDYFPCMQISVSSVL